MTHFSPTLQLDNINVFYKGNAHVLQNISLTLSGGHVYGLVGENGAGKSTLFKTITGLITPSTGRVIFNGQPLAYSLKKQLIAYMPQVEEVDWDFPIQVRDVVMTGRYGRMSFLRIPSAQDKEIVEESLAQVGLCDLADRQIGALSGGQKKRVFLARALAQQAQMLLLDEPFSGVDIKSEEIIIQVFNELKKQGKLILISTHNFSNLSSYCDKLILLNKKIICFDTLEKCFTPECLNQLFSTIAVSGLSFGLGRGSSLC